MTPAETKAAGGVDKNRGGAETLRRYWVTGTGGVEIGWGTKGDFDRCVAKLTEHMGARAKGYCNLRHRDATGKWPAQHKGITPVEQKAWDEAAHPRHDEGGPTGGRFKEKDAGEEGGPDREELTDAERKKIRDIVDQITGGGTRKDMTPAQRQALRKMVDVMVEPVDRDSDKASADPWEGMGDDDRKLMRSVIDDMTGDGRYRDLPASARAAVRVLREGLNDDEEKSLNYTPVPATTPCKGCGGTKGADNAVSDGVMVAFYAPREAAEAVGHDDPTDMHLTLAYLGKVDEVGDVEALKDVVAAYAAEQADLPGQISGVGRFAGGDEGDPVYASVDAPRLPDFRAGLVSRLTEAGFPPRADHGFTPHMTLRYVGKDEPTGLERIEPLDTTFDVLSVAYGPDVWDYPMRDGE